MTNALLRAGTAAVAVAALLATSAACGTERDRPPAAAPPAAPWPAAPTPGAPVPGVSPPGTRGALLSVQPLESLTAAQVRTYLAGQGVDGSRVRFGVAASRISYATVDPTGRPTTASALVTTPTAAPGQSPGTERRMVSWQHGTIAARDEVGSMTADGSDRAAAVLFAAAGYLVSAPDYLGLGTGPGFHPYLDLPSTVSASVDSLRATRALAQRPNRRGGPGLDGQVLVSGHSQGGQAAMAVGEELWRGADPSFRLAAVDPIAGPFQVSATLHTAVTTGIEHASAYLAYFAVAWNRLHHLYDTPQRAFRAPYDRTVPELLDGNHSGDSVLAALPGTPAELFTPEFLNLLRNPTGPLAEALAVADSSCDWRPEVPVRLYAASGDRDVPIANSRFCQRQVLAAGGAAALVDVGPVDHSTSELRALPQVLAGFDQLGRN
jgi:hypothetical protein